MTVTVGQGVTLGAGTSIVVPPPVITTGLSMWLDASNPASYSGSGTTWADLSGNGNDQTLVNSPTYVTGATSYFDFDGVSQYSTGSTPVLGVNTYTKMVWFQFNTTGTDNNLVSSDTGGHFMYGANTPTMWSGNANNPPYNQPGSSFGSNTSFNSGTWYCATVVFSNPQIWLYVNGVQDAYDPTYTASGRGGDGSTNLACFSPGGNLLNGRIAEVLCYGSALNANQVLQNFMATHGKYGV